MVVSSKCSDTRHEAGGALAANDATINRELTTRGKHDSELSQHTDNCDHYQSSHHVCDRGNYQLSRDAGNAEGSV